MEGQVAQKHLVLQQLHKSWGWCQVRRAGLAGVMAEGFPLCGANEDGKPASMDE